MTALYDDIVYGPVHSRRLGLSLGVNLLPLRSKICSFDCIYCECGWNGDHPGERTFHERGEVAAALASCLRQSVQDGAAPDVITFAGNGEPTLHPDFERIIDDTLALRDKLSPAAKVAVLSNATQLGREDVRRALARVDGNILKIDSAFDETVRIMNAPCGQYSVAETVGHMKSFGGGVIVQTMFLRGEFGGRPIDNTSKREVEAWLGVLREIEPAQVMVYSIARDTPCKTVHRVSRGELESIAARVEASGIKCSVA